MNRISRLYNMSAYYALMRLEQQYSHPEFGPFVQHLAKAKSEYIAVHLRFAHDNNISTDWELLGSYLPDKELTALIKTCTQPHHMNIMLSGTCSTARTSMCHMLIMRGAKQCQWCSNNNHLRFAASIRIFAVRQMGLLEDVCKILVRQCVAVIIGHFLENDGTF